MISSSFRKIDRRFSRVDSNSKVSGRIICKLVGRTICGKADEFDRSDLFLVDEIVGHADSCSSSSSSYSNSYSNSSITGVAHPFNRVSYHSLKNLVSNLRRQMDGKLLLWFKTVVSLPPLLEPRKKSQQFTVRGVTRGGLWQILEEKLEESGRAIYCAGGILSNPLGRIQLRLFEWLPVEFSG